MKHELYEAIHRYATRLLGDAEAAKDVTQETFLRFEQHRGEISQPRAWLYRTARNLVIDHFRNKSRKGGGGIYSGAVLTEVLPNDLPAEATRFSPALLAEKKETLNMLSEKMNDLPDRHREVLRLKFQEGLKYAEIAEVLKLSVPTVGWLLHEAIAKLREEMTS